MSKPTFTRPAPAGGTWTLIDERGDPTWGDVQAVERFTDENGRLGIVINHRDYEKAIAPYQKDDE